MSRRGTRRAFRTHGSISSRKNGDDLLERFFGAFESRSDADDGLDGSSRSYLVAFLHGADSEESLRLRILKRLEEVVTDRQSLRSRRRGSWSAYQAAAAWTDR